MTCFINFSEMALGYTIHAQQRAMQRGFTTEQVAALIRYGRKKHFNGAVYYSVGHKEIDRFAVVCPLLKKMNGLHLIMSVNGQIITLFRNTNFKAVFQYRH